MLYLGRKKCKLLQILTWAIPAKLSVIASSLLKREIIRFSHCFCVPNCPVVRGQQKFSCRRAFELNENWLQPRDVWFQICVRKLPLSVIWNLLTDFFVEEGNFPQFRCFIVSSEKTKCEDWVILIDCEYMKSYPVHAIVQIVFCFSS